MNPGARGGPLLAGVAGLVLFACLFLSWFRVDGASFDIQQIPGVQGLNIGDLPTKFEFSDEDIDSIVEQQSACRSCNAWESFGLIDLVLALTAIVAVALLLATFAGASDADPRLARALSLAVAALGLLSLVLLAYRLINPPELIEAVGGQIQPGTDLQVDTGRQIGLFFGLLATLGVAAGGLLSLAGTAPPRRSRPRPARGVSPPAAPPAAGPPAPPSQ